MVGIAVVRAIGGRLELGEDGVEFREGLEHIGRGVSWGFRDRVGDELDAGPANGAMEGVGGRGAEGRGPGRQIGPAFRRFLRWHSQSALGRWEVRERQLSLERTPVGVGPSVGAVSARGVGRPGVVEMTPERGGEEVLLVADRGRDDAGQLQAFAPGFQVRPGLSPHQGSACVLDRMEEEQGSRPENEGGVGDGREGARPEPQPGPGLRCRGLWGGVQALGPMVPTAPRK